MADQDDAEREAAELLPCLRGCGPLHMADCPVAYRPAVAAALRERDEQIATLRELREFDAKKIAALEAERDALRLALQSSEAALLAYTSTYTSRRHGSKTKKTKDLVWGVGDRAALAQRPKP